MVDARYEYFIYNHEQLKVNESNLVVNKDHKLIYEVIRIIDGMPLFFKEHMLRLENSCKLLGLTDHINNANILDDFIKLSKINKIYEGNIKLIIDSTSKELFIFFINHSYPEKVDYERGVKTILYHGERKNPNAKVVNNDFRTKVNKEIEIHEAYEAILIDNEGYITEGSKSNIFMVKENTVYTAPLKAVLPGVTRDKIIKVIKKLGIEFKEESIKEEEIKTLDGLFISGTSPKVLPINSIDKCNFNSSKNELIITIMKDFDEELKKDINIIKNSIK